MAESLQQKLLLELGRLLEPLSEATLSPYRRGILFDAIGWDLEQITGLPIAQLDESLQECKEAVDRILALTDPGPSGLDDLTTALDEVAQAIESVEALSNMMGDAGLPMPSDFDRLGSDLVSYLTISYLQTYHPTVYAILVLLALIIPAEEVEPVGAVVDANTGALVRHPHARPQLRLNLLGRLLSDPLGTLKEEYVGADGLKTTVQAEATADKLFPRIEVFLRTLGVDAVYGIKPSYGLDFGPAGNAFAAHMLSVRAALDPGQDLAGSELGATLALSAEDQGDLGLIVAPFGTLQFNPQLVSWILEFTLTGSVSGFAVGPRGVAWPSGTLPSGADPQVRASLTASKLPGPGGGAFLLGSTEGTRMEIGRFAITGDASFDAARQDFGFLIEAGQAAFVVDPGDGDGFLQKILPQEGLRTGFDLALGWSNSRGLYFRGSAGLDATLPVHKSLLGVLRVDSVYLSLSAQDADIQAVIAATASARLGPFIANVERVGLLAKFTFPESGGNLGPANVVPEFKRPDGVGLAIDSSVVVGGGYLFIDRQKGEYAGGLQLEFKGIGLQAHGLLNTRMPDGSPIRMPDGSEGFSLLILISAEFTPVNLGFGFTLNNVGGLLGVHRTAAVDVLRSGIRTRTLDSIMFPSDPIANASRIIGTLGSVFPVSPGRYVFGPMARLGWGTPTLLTIDVGLVLELPAPVRLIVLGRLRLVLPKEDAAVVRINMDVLGIIDFDRADVSVDAILYDSRLAGFTLTGDMAMRANWSAAPGFALSAGGFNPRFQPPPGFPALRRLTLALATGNNPRLRLETYLALTSNTVQLGARLDLYVAAAGFSVEGMLAFDALLQLAPFGFIVDIAGAVALKHGTQTLMAVGIQLTLSGPTPWHAYGKATFQLWIFKISVGFDVRIGGGPPPPLPPPVDVGELLDRELKKPGNWTAQLAPEGESLVTLRKLEPAEDELLAHPLGSVGFDQRIAPLDVMMTRYGSARIAGENRFAVTEVSYGSMTVSGTQAVNEYFAPAQFLDLTDAEKISRPSFELMEAGRRLAPPGFSFDATAPESAPLEYDTILVDAPDRPGRVEETVKLAREDLERLAAASAAALMAPRASGPARFAAEPVSVEVRDTTYAVAELDPASGSPNTRGARGTTYTAAAEELRRRLAREPQARRRLRIVAAGRRSR